MTKAEKLYGNGATEYDACTSDKSAFDNNAFGNVACDERAAYGPPVRNNEMNLAWQYVTSTGVNLFLTGKAGTGKTTFLKKLRELMPKRMVVLAPTGVAAINAGGQTIHSFFQLPLGPFVPGITRKTNGYKMSQNKKNLIRTLDLLVIDEISMVRADLLDQIDDTLRRYRDYTKPFGGVQLLLIGDLMQLSPVVKPEEWDMLSKVYETPYFFSSLALKKTSLATIELKHIYRQQDAVFINLLGKVRRGDIDNECISLLNSRYIPGFEPSEKGWIRLSTHNYTVQQYNDNRLAKLQAAEHTFHATVQGEFPEYAYPTDASLRLKSGAQVMFVKNDPSPQHAYYNGKIGVITDITDEGIEVTCEDNEVIYVTPLEWENTKYVLDTASKSISEEIAGTFTQYPLRLAWAITVHKSQGLTFDRAILDINASFAHGQVYVALSRCRTLEGLVLSGSIHPSSVITDHSVNSFIDSAIASSDDNIENLPQHKKEYTLTLLDELFSFDAISRDLEWLTRVVDEHLGSQAPRLLDALKEAQSLLEVKISVVAERFKAQYHAFSAAGGDLADPSLTARIKGSAEYFEAKIKEIFTPVFNLSKISLNNKRVAELYNNALGALRPGVKGKAAIFEKLISELFTPGKYLEIKAKAFLDSVQTVSGKTSGKKSTAATSFKTSESAKPGKTKQPKEPKKTGEPRQPKAPKEPKKPTAEITFELYCQGLSPEEIAKKRGMSPITIYGHIATLVSQKKLPYEKFVTPEARREILKAIASSEGAYTLTDIHNKLGGKYTFNDIKIAISTLEN